MKKLLGLTVIAVAMMIVPLTTTHADHCYVTLESEETDEDTGCTVSHYSKMCFGNGGGTFELYDEWNCQ